MEVFKLITAFSAIALPLLLLVIFQLSAKNGMTISLVIFTLLAFFIWGVDLITIFSASIAGFTKTLSILWILLGALFLLNLLRVAGIIDLLINQFKNITSDKRIQLIIIGFFFVGILEAAAGFGAPAAIAAPLLISLGFSPLAAATLALIGNAVPMTFGAVGTPLLYGMKPAIVDGSININHVATGAAYIDIFLGSFIPVIQILLYAKVFSERKSFKYALDVIPFALLSGLIYTSLAYISTIVLGAEFGALIGSIVGILIIITLVKWKILIPSCDDVHEKKEQDFKTIAKAWAPYIIVVLLLLITRLSSFVKDFLQKFTIEIDDILGTGIHTSFDIFYSPGFILIITAIIVILTYGIEKDKINEAVDLTLTSAKRTTLALLPALVMVYIFLNSDINKNDFISMPKYIGETLSLYLADSWIFIAPFIGNLGTFISGSTTTSNIMFSQLQYDIAIQNGLDPVKILTAQALGANTGCMISISKVVASCAVVGLTGKEFKLLRITVGISLVYALLVGIFVNFLL